MSQQTRRLRQMKLGLLALFASAALFGSPKLAERLYAQTGTSSCSADCTKGSCTATGANCSCTCGIFTGVPYCSCDTEEEPVG